MRDRAIVGKITAVNAGGSDHSVVDKLTTTPGGSKLNHGHIEIKQALQLGIKPVSGKD